MSNEIDPQLQALLDGMVWEGLEGDIPLLMFDKGEIGIVLNTLEDAEQARDELRLAWGQAIQAYAQERVEAREAAIVEALEAIEREYRDEEERTDWIEGKVRCSRAASNFLRAINIVKGESQ